MSRKNNELEGTLRKLRSQGRKLESERDRLAGRLASLEASPGGRAGARHACHAGCCHAGTFLHGICVEMGCWN